MSQPTHMLPEDLQRSNEYQYTRKHIDKYLRNLFATDPGAQQKVQEGVAMLKQWMEQGFFESKQARINQLKGFDLHALVTEIFIGIAYIRRPETFVSVTGLLASRLNFDDKADSIATIAEVTAVLCQTDVFDITKANRQASLMIVSNIGLPDALIDAMERSLYVMPMVCPPKTVTSNNESGYLTFNDNLMLGKGNSHSGDLCLDIINTQNSTPLSLDLEFLSTVDEQPKSAPVTTDQKLEWDRFKAQSYQVYSLMASQGNRFYLTHKVDKRGRLYAQGYHITTQGSAFKKAMVELAEPELITGVPV